MLTCHVICVSIVILLTTIIRLMSGYSPLSCCSANVSYRLAVVIAALLIPCYFANVMLHCQCLAALPMFHTASCCHCRSAIVMPHCQCLAALPLFHTALLLSLLLCQCHAALPMPCCSANTLLLCQCFLLPCCCHCCFTNVMLHCQCLAALPMFHAPLLLP